MKTKIILSSLSMMLVAFLISAFAAGESNIQKTTVEGAKTSKINRKSNSTKATKLVKFNANQDVYSTIMQRVQEMEWDNAGSVSSLDNTVDGLITSINADGSWSDINYASNAQTDWQPIQHLNRLKSMVLAYTLNSSSHVGNTDLFLKITKALEFWHTSDPRSTNWFNQQIGSPQRVGVILILMRAGQQQISSNLENNMLTRMESIGGRPDQSGSQGTGANKVDIATHWVYRGCLKSDSSVLSFGVDQVYYPVFMTTAEGLQQDYSYFQHGQQFFTGGYGVSFISGIARIANFTIGTSYELPDAKRVLLTNFTRDAYLRLIRGKYFLYNTIGRGLSRTGALNASGSISLAKIVKNLDMENASEYDASIKRLNAQEAADYGVSPKHIHYWRADYTLYNSSAYYFDVRMASTRTLRNENGNGENLKGYFLSEGAHTIAVDGDEYYNIFPVWDWTKIPGITAPQKSTIPLPAQWGTVGTSNFAGGVSNGSVGVTVFQLNNKEYSINTNAKKTWFMFGNEIVCLGSSITSTASEPINTTINQSLLKGDVVVKSNDTESVLSTSSHNIANSSWVYHNKVGYVFPQPTTLKISNKTESGNWKAINSSYSDDTVSADVFKMWIDHGTQPVEAKYEYIILPGKSLEEVRDYDSSNIQVLINSDSLQVVRNVSQNILSFVFYKAASYTNDDFRLKVNGACAMMLKDGNTSTVSAWISDPSQLRKDIAVRFKSTLLAHEKEIQLNLPAVPYAGSTLAFVIDENSENYIFVPTEEIKKKATDDTHVVNGSSAAANYGANPTLIIKKDNAGYNREVFLKFDLSGLNPDSIVKADLSLYVNSSNISVTATNWQLYYVPNDNWSESTLTWNNMPTKSTLLGIFPGSVAGTNVVYDLKQTVIDELKKPGDTKLSLQLISSERGADAKTDAQFYSKENADASKHPSLIVEQRIAELTTTTPALNMLSYIRNPLLKGEDLKIQITDAYKGLLHINIHDVSGRTIYSQTLNTSSDKSIMGINTSDLTEGVYFITLASALNKKTETLKLFVR